MSIVSIGILILFYVFVSVLDIKHLSIPVGLWTIPVAIILVSMTSSSFSVSELGMRALFGGIFFAFGIVLCLVKDMGGADALMMMSVGLAFGAFGIYMILFGFVCAIPVALFAKHKSMNKKDFIYPLLPSLTIGVIIALGLIKLLGISTSLINI